MSVQPDPPVLVDHGDPGPPPWADGAMPDPEKYVSSELFVAGALSTMEPFSGFHPAWALPFARTALEALGSGTPMSDVAEPHFDIVMPFVVCASQGGPHEDGAFVSGFECGRLDARLEYQRPVSVHETFRTDSMPQVDLIAMRHGYSVTSEPWEEHPEEWTIVVLTRLA